MAQPSPVENLCAMCEQPGVHACAGCHAIRYCSKLCQKMDWPLHKLLCKTYKDFDDKTRPKPHDSCIYKRAIHFPENGNAPRFVWMRYFDLDHMGIAAADTTYVTQDNSILDPVAWIKHSMVLKRPLHRPIGVTGNAWPRGMENMDHAGIENKSLLKVDKELSQWFHGSFIAIGHKGSYDPTGPASITIKPFEVQTFDLEPVDLRHIVDRMRADHYKLGLENKVYLKGSAEKVKGVRINCMGDKTMCLQRAYETVDAAKSLCSEDTDLPSPLADKIGMPLVICKIPHPLCWRGRHNQGRFCTANPQLARLDPQKYFSILSKVTPGTPALMAELGKLAVDMGSCVVVRKDGKALDSKHIRALTGYLEGKINEGLIMGEDGGAPDDILDMVSKEEWEKFYAEFLEGFE
jgi:hypothetical protein